MIVIFTLSRLSRVILVLLFEHLSILDVPLGQMITLPKWKINIIHKVCKFMVPWFYFISRPISWILLLGHLLDCEGLVALWYDHYCPGHNWKLFVDGENLWISPKWRKNLLHKKVPTSLLDSNDERIHWQNSWCPIFENPIANFGEGNGILGSSEICGNNQGSID